MKRNFSRGQIGEEPSRQSGRLREQGIWWTKAVLLECKGQGEQRVRLRLGHMLLELFYIDYLA